MDATRLRYFTTVARTGSLRAAAELLHISPAALSKALKLLEHEVGATLIVPAGRGIQVTQEGQWLAKRASPLLDDLDELGRELKKTNQTERPLRVGSFEVFTTYFLGFLVEEVFVDSPILIHELLPGEIEKAVAEYQVDVGLTYIPVPTPEVDFLKVTQIQMGLYGKKGSFSKVPFDRVPFVIPVSPVSGSPTKVKGLDGWPEDKFDRYVRYQVTMMESALELCRRGKAVAYLPSFIVRLHNSQCQANMRLEARALPSNFGNTRFPVYLVKRKSEEENARIKKLSKALRLAVRSEN